MTIDIQLSHPSAWSRTLTIKVPATRIAEERTKVTKRLAKRASLPGFRKGKVPPQILEKQFGQDIDQEVLQSVIDSTFREALDSHSLQPISQGEVGDLKYKPGEDAEFAITFDVRPEVDLKRVDGFKVPLEASDVGAGEVDKVLDKLRRDRAPWEPVEGGRMAANGDMATIRVITLDDAGAPKSAEAARTYDIVLGDGRSSVEVDEAIRSLAPGESGDFTLPGGDPDKGEPTTLRARIELLEVQTPKLAALDDEFAKSLGSDFDSLDALRAKIREDLENESSRRSVQARREALLDKVVEANTFELPASMVDRYIDAMMGTPDSSKIDAETLKAVRTSAKPSAETGLRRLMVIERIAEMNSLAATEDEVTTKIAEIAASLGRSAKDLKKDLEKHDRLHRLEHDITEERVFAWLEEKNPAA